MESIYNISVRTNLGEDFYLLLGDFLDVFYCADTDTRAGMIDASPVDMAKPEFVPFLAATAHKLSIDYKINPPLWVFEPRCYLSGMTPHFAYNYFSY